MSMIVKDLQCPQMILCESFLSHTNHDTQHTSNPLFAQITLLHTFYHHNIAMNLRVGEFIDACAWNERWLVAEIVHVHSNSDILVRFPGWARRDEELIETNELASQTAPLYYHTYDRDSWKVGDKVDYLCCEEADIWVQASVVGVNSVKGVVDLKVPRSLATRALKVGRAPVLVDEVSVGLITEVNILGDRIAPLRTFTTELTDADYEALFKRRIAAAHSDDPPTVSVASRTYIGQQKRKLDAVYDDLETHWSSRSTSSQRPSPDTWLAPLLRARHVSDAHILLCEKVLIDKEGFATWALFAAFSDSLVPFLTSIGITGRGLQLNLIQLHLSLQARAVATQQSRGRLSSSSGNSVVLRR